MKAWFLVALAGVCSLSALLAALFLSGEAVKRRERELAHDARAFSVRSGIIEYAVRGEGEPIVVLHGAGGGFDQGLLIAQSFIGSSYRIIAPSRFGYLGSTLPEDASTAAQADALAELLDELAIERVSVVAFSGGGPPALQFSERHAQRTRCLALISSAPFTPYAPPSDTRPIPDWLYQALFGSDVLYWTLSKTNPNTLSQAFDVRPDLAQNLADEDARMIDALVSGFIPASRRAEGVFNEAAAIDPRARYQLENIEAPTLVIHARDDRINGFAVAEAIAARAPNAHLIALESGGHLLLGAHPMVRQQVSSFLANCTGS